jgi:hypothetical protein
MVISLLLMIWSAANKRLGIGAFFTPTARASVEWMAVRLHRDLLVMSPFVPSLLTRYWNLGRLLLMIILLIVISNL